MSDPERRYTHKYKTTPTINCLSRFSIFSAAVLLLLPFRRIFYHVSAKEMTQFVCLKIYFRVLNSQLTRVHSRERQMRASAIRLRRRPAPVFASRWDLYGNEKRGSFFLLNMQLPTKWSARYTHKMRQKWRKNGKKKFLCSVGWLHRHTTMNAKSERK